MYTLTVAMDTNHRRSEHSAEVCFLHGLTNQRTLSSNDGLDETTVVNLHAVDMDDGTQLGDISYDVRFVCANVGDAAGSWVGSDLHLRFQGWALEDLAGRSAEVTMTVTAPSGDEVDAALEGLLTLMGK